MRYKFDHQPRRGEKFNDQSRGPYRSNGYILDIHWREQEVVVKFYCKDPSSHEMNSYSFDEIEGCWTEAYGGTWIVNETDTESNWLKNFIASLT